MWDRDIEETCTAILGVVITYIACLFAVGLTVALLAVIGSFLGAHGAL